ncbi:MAG: lysostaphin resistance A-like protein [Gemmatimonadales bacterium]
MSSSPDLSPRARVLLAAGLVLTAWGLPRAPGDAAALGGTTVSLAAGLCGLVALTLGRQPLGLLWAPARAARPAPDVARGFAVGALCAAVLVFDGNVGRLGALWRDDRAGSVALVLGVAVWGAALAATRQRALWQWYVAAAGIALLPEVALVGVLQPSVSLGALVAPLLFFLVADTTVALVTEELAFRRALLGRPESVRLGSLGLMALAFGLWHVVQPGYDGAPVENFLGTALGGFVTGCLYALSGSLTVAAFYHGLHDAPLKALGGVPVTAGRAGLAGGIALACTALLALGLGWMVLRRGERESGRLS